jgi:hypothetical protein
MKFQDSLVIVHEQMLHDELSPVGQDLAELREGPGQKIRLRLVVTGQRDRLKIGGGRAKGVFFASVL